jgi:hypothetical protein
MMDLHDRDRPEEEDLQDSDGSEEEDWHRAAAGEQKQIAETHCITFQLFFMQWGERSPEEVLEKLCTYSRN